MNTKGKSRWAMAAALSGMVLVAACEGSNLFDTQAAQNTEPRVQVFAPASVFAGDTVTVNLSATAPLNIQRIEVSMRGAVTKDTLILTAAVPSMNAVLKVGTPAVLPTDMVLISAQVADLSGRLSRTAADTVMVLTN